MFKFDFQIEDIETESPFVENKSNTEREKVSTENSSIDWYDSEEIFYTKNILENLDICKLNSVQRDVDDIHICYMVSGFLLEDIKHHDDNNVLDIKKAEEQHSDLIPGVYEGGAKIWECTDDLLKYLAENYNGYEWNKANVLDLGCGTGLLGIYAFLKGAKVTFQDYNRDVLAKITMPNLLLNTVKHIEIESEEFYNVEQLKENSRFYSGDWSKWCEKTQCDQCFDIILTSETIYNPQNHQKLLDCLHDKLKSNGVALVAAKTYYFGVGGGLREFEKLIEADKRFKCKVVWLSSKGVNREIIELSKVI